VRSCEDAFYGKQKHLYFPVHREEMLVVREERLKHGFGKLIAEITASSAPQWKTSLPLSGNHHENRDIWNRNISKGYSVNF
jgi:hypothetical protein